MAFIDKSEELVDRLLKVKLEDLHGENTVSGSIGDRVSGSISA